MSLQASIPLRQSVLQASPGRTIVSFAQTFKQGIVLLAYERFDLQCENMSSVVR